MAESDWALDKRGIITQRIQGGSQDLAVTARGITNVGYDCTITNSVPDLAIEYQII